MTHLSACGTSLLRGRRFHCREWAVEKLRRWLDARSDPAPGHAPVPGVLVTGGPGAGKTALCTEVVWPTSRAGQEAGLARRCLAFHFCHREERSSTAAGSFVLSLAEQISRSELLQSNHVELEPLACQSDPHDAFKRAVLQPLLDLTPPPQPLLLLVDALDLSPALDRGPASIAELLASHLPLFPPWLLLVCSVRRQNKALCKMFSGFRRLCLDDLRKPSPVHDVQQYILWRLDEDAALRRQLTPDTADMLNLLHIKSGGCFLFLQRVLDGVAANLIGLREIRDIPGTLNGLYLWLCQRLFPRALFTNIRPVLNVLLAATRPLTAQQVFTAVWTQDTSLSFRDFQNKLRTLSPLLIDGPDDTKLLFHASFAEWLLDVKYCTQKYLCSQKEGHTMLAMALTLRGAHLASEDVCELAEHLVSSGEHKNNPSLLALWMLWANVPSLNATASLLATSSVGEDVRHLLNISGILDADFSIEGIGEEIENLKRAFERELSIKRLLDSGVAVNQRNSADGRTLLANSAAEGSEHAAEFLLNHGADPLISDQQGQTPLTLASRQGHISVLKVLLDWARRQERDVAAKMLEHVDTEGWTALRAGAWGGHIEVVKSLLDAGADVDGCDSEGKTALRATAWGGHEEIVKTLLEFRASVDKADSDGRTSLIAASYMGHQETVEILLDHGANVNLADGDGRTALSVAALCVPKTAEGRGFSKVARCRDGMALYDAREDGIGEIVNTPLRHGASVDKPDSDGRTLLTSASYMGHQETVGMLLGRGAKLNSVDGDVRKSRSVTSLSALRGHSEVAGLLLDRGANPSHRDRDGMTPLLLASYEGNEEVVELLLEAGADVDETAGPVGEVQSAAAVTPLLAAAAMGHMGTVSKLLFWGADVDAVDAEGRTALCVAAARGSVEVVRALLDRGLDENHKDDLGWTPLHAAACEGHRAVCGVMIEQSGMVRVGEMDIEGRTALILAAQEGHVSTVRLLLDKRCPIDHRAYDGHSALSAALLEEQTEVAELLMRRGADTDVRDAEGRPLLYLLALEDRVEMARLLLEKGGVPLESRDAEGRTALHVACWHGSADMVDLLLRHCANPNAQDAEGRPPLHSVAWTGRCQAGRRLLDAPGLDVDLCCHQKATALSVAAQEGHVNVVALLLERGANPEHIDKYYRTPMKVASKHGHANVMRLLESYGAKPYVGLTPRSRTVSPIKLPSAVPECNGAVFGGVIRETSSSSMSSPGSTAERFHSIQSSQTSSTCHSLATVQTVPADSISFVHLIQQHSLPRARSRPSTLPHHGSVLGSAKRRTKDSPPPSVCRVTAMVHQSEQSRKSGDGPKASYTAGKWHSVMASLGITPGQDRDKPSPTEYPNSYLLQKDLESPNSKGYPNSYLLQKDLESPNSKGYPNSYLLQKDLNNPPPIEYANSYLLQKELDNPTPIGYPYSSPWEKDILSFSPHIAFADDPMLTISTKDPQLNLKQAIKLQFEGPTSAALYKRETPL